MERNNIFLLLKDYYFNYINNDISMKIIRYNNKIIIISFYLIIHKYDKILNVIIKFFK